ncbi:GFA family protein (plasmid) [Paracoccus sp. TK19116]|uniref:GFA family protein n=1 Tax=Paracoccus albicereus TaxID=2922394 RepID=A0ABT1ML62_9RHOB|nr:GFA family protein [Paracoccus albicereus]MCQ0969032.1 GFA family protein [Paracoccus albicereus]
MSGTIHGRCLCGDVTIALSRWTPEISACHCANCRRAGGGLMAGFDAPADAVTVTGEVRRFRAVDFAERAFCPRCGANLWLRDDGGDYELSPALFDDAATFPLVREVYADCAMRFATLAGDHPRIERTEYESQNPHVEASQ